MIRAKSVDSGIILWHSARSTANFLSSHDLEVERKQVKRNLYADDRDEKLDGKLKLYLPKQCRVTRLR